MEGSPIQELAALEVNRNTNAIMDVFLGHAYTDEPDNFSRRHIHGLNKDIKEVWDMSFSNDCASLNFYKQSLRGVVQDYVINFNNEHTSISDVLYITQDLFK